MNYKRQTYLEHHTKRSIANDSISIVSETSLHTYMISTVIVNNYLRVSFYFPKVLLSTYIYFQKSLLKSDTYIRHTHI